MTIQDIKDLVNNSTDYAFLRSNPHLGNSLVFLTLGGSYAYGTNVTTSDVDVRGCAFNSARDILLHRDFETVCNEATDTTVYSFDKLISLLTACNPNTIELLGCKPEHYIYTTGVGKMLIDNRAMFLSQRAINSFGGYAGAQLRRLSNRSNRMQGQVDNEKHILATIKNVETAFCDKYAIDSHSLKLYIDKAVSDELETEIFMDCNFKHYPVRDYLDMWNELKSIIKSYKGLGPRNSKAIEHAKLGKHMMHLVRLYYMVFDILERGEINTYREKEHDLLMQIRDGVYLDDNKPNAEFDELINQLENRFTYAKNNTVLPESPNMEWIEDFIVSVNKGIVCS